MEYTEIKTQLVFGDVSTIAKECGVSAQTVQCVIRGENRHTIAGQAVMKALEFILSQRAERQEYLRKFIAELKAKRKAENEKL
jgi:predicted transcriptional regulator